MEKKNNLSGLWEQDGGDFHAHIGHMRKAVTLSRQPNGYAISHRSYFPFQKSHYDLRFETVYEAAEFSISVIKDWVQSIFQVESEQPMIEQEAKVISMEDQHRNQLYKRILNR